MSDQGQWQVTGNAAETYERALVPAVFAAGAPPDVRAVDVPPRPPRAFAGRPARGNVVTRFP
jgi:hypothetical protein